MSHSGVYLNGCLLFEAEEGRQLASRGDKKIQMDILLLALYGQDVNLFLYFEVSDPVDLKHVCFVKRLKQDRVGTCQEFHS